MDISLDEDGVIQESQCECGAGMAPTAHCKHVTAVIYGLTLFVKSGNLLTELTCTQVFKESLVIKPLFYVHRKVYRDIIIKSRLIMCVSII